MFDEITRTLTPYFAISRSHVPEKPSFGNNKRNFVKEGNRSGPIIETYPYETVVSTVHCGWAGYGLFSVRKKYDAIIGCISLPVTLSTRISIFAVEDPY